MNKDFHLILETAAEAKVPMLATAAFFSALASSSFPSFKSVKYRNGLSQITESHEHVRFTEFWQNRCTDRGR
jgi:hypothetical protein